MAADINKYQPKKSSIKPYILIPVIVILVYGVIGVLGVGRYLETSRKGSIHYYCLDAKLSAYEPYVESGEFALFNGKHQNYDFGYKSLESKKYKDESKLLASLPGSFSEAIKDAVNNGKHEEAFDMDGNPVTRYYVTADKLPLDESDSSSDLEHYYFVYKYSDGSYRFAVLAEVTDPDL